jgi:hypothetical protein
MMQPFFQPGAPGAEFGSIDTYGHNQGAKLAWRVEEGVGLQQRILELIHVGWKNKDNHGSRLLLLRRVAQSRTAQASGRIRWNRCAIKRRRPARLSDDLMVLGRRKPSSGSRCIVFLAGMEYAHGGLTLQEALIPSLTLSTKQTGGRSLLF